MRVPPRPWTVLLGVAAALTGGALLVVDRDVIGAAHPAWAVLLVAIVLGGASAVVVGLRRPPRRRRRVLGALVALAVVLGLAAVVWLRPLGVSETGRAALASDAAVTVVDGRREITLLPVSTRRATGVVFYPGAKVDPRAYVRILRPVAAAGFPVVILRLPLGIAFGDPNGASRAIGANPAVERWIVGGHSLGGTVAARFADAGHRPVVGLLLWASYPAGSIADAPGLQVLSVSATNDGLATPAKIDASRANLPADTTFVAVAGAVHADFGDYGPQKGDGTPTIAHDEAQRRIVDATLRFVVAVDAG